MRDPLKLMLFSTANIGLVRSFVGIGEGVGRGGVTVGLSLGVTEFFTSLVGTGDGLACTPETGVGVG
jgi:hypothetical protein